MEQLIYTINGVNYVLIELPVTENNQKKVQKTAEDHDCIFQGVKEIKRSLFFGGHAIIKYLVPEQRLIAFNKAL
jgi:hypothetical protein